MKWFTRMTSAAVIAAVAVAAVVAAPKKSETDVQQLQQQVQALEAQVKAMNDQMKAMSDRMASMDAKLQAAEVRSAAPNQERENQGSALFNEARTLAGQNQPDAAKAKLEELQNKYAGTRAAAQSRTLAAELAVVGKDSPGDWRIAEWFQGEKDIDLSGKKTTLVVFWEEWCPHCKREVPKLQQLYTDHKASGLQIIGLTKLSKGVTADKLRSFIADNKVSYPIAKEDGSMSTYFNVSGVPAAAVVRGGKVIWRGHPSQLSEATLKGWL